MYRDGTPGLHLPRLALGACPWRVSIGSMFSLSYVIVHGGRGATIAHARPRVAVSLRQSAPASSDLSPSRVTRDATPPRDGTRQPRRPGSPLALELRDSRGPRGERRTPATPWMRVQHFHVTYTRDYSLSSIGRTRSRRLSRLRRASCVWPMRVHVRRHAHSYNRTSLNGSHAASSGGATPSGRMAAHRRPGLEGPLSRSPQPSVLTELSTRRMALGSPLLHAVAWYRTCAACAAGVWCARRACRAN